jgi:aspartyl protease family protein
MKRFEFIALFFITIPLQGQIVHTKEVRIKLNEGWDDARLKLEVCNIITDKIDIKFKEDLEYNWYNEFSGQIMSSKGASGGSLLHGKCSSYDGTGNLVDQGYYKFGLQDSIWLFWDEHGEISSKYIFKNGVCTYSKDNMGDSGIWETFGSLGKLDFHSKYYTDKNILDNEMKCISINPPILEWIYYYPNLKTIRKYYYWANGNFYGNYAEYLPNGSLKCSGDYDKKYKLGSKVGLWLVFNESLNKMDSIKYKLSESNIGSTGDKEIGSLVYLPESKEWIKYGEWHTLDNTGSVKDSKTYESNPFEKNNEIKITNPISEAPTNSIKFVKSENGLIEVPVVLNDVLRINFIFDSGASEVSLSPDVALTLIRTGTITENDFLPDQTYTFADGSSAKSKRFLIRKLMIGNQTLTNIEASISKSIEAPMLIGQNVMQKLGSITIDYENLLLIIRSR